MSIISKNDDLIFFFCMYISLAHWPELICEDLFSGSTVKINLNNLACP